MRLTSGLLSLALLICGLFPLGVRSASPHEDPLILAIHPPESVLLLTNDL